MFNLVRKGSKNKKLDSTKFFEISLVFILKKMHWNRFRLRCSHFWNTKFYSILLCVDK